jgi:magnesium transporter
MSRAILFDADETREMEAIDEPPSRLGGDQLLWVDLDRGDRDEAARVAKALELDDDTLEELAGAGGSAAFRNLGRYIHVTTYAPRSDDDDRLHAVECVVGANWVVTAHDRPVDVLDDFAAKLSDSGSVGSLDGPGFLEALLEWVLASYTAAFDSIEARLEEFDVDAMRGKGTDDDIERLVTLRREVGHLRRALAAHRPMLVALDNPALEAFGGDGPEGRFDSLMSRFETTVQEARDVREAIVGSFDVLIARIGHETNHVMKVLTLVSVILLPGALIAGVMGMNFKVGLFDDPNLFWPVLGVIVGIAPVSVLVARMRKWI